MQKVRSFTVLPSLPEPLKELKTIAMNMYWSWNSEFIELFRRIDTNLWETCAHNPMKLLGTVSQARLDDLADNEGFICQLQRCSQKLSEHLAAPNWFEKVYSKNSKPVIAYFSAEFGIHEALPIYSGGLGILAGDHLKSASDLGVPLVGIGLLYQKGYFRQYLNTDGWQQESYTENDFYNMPIELIRKKNSSRALTISVQFPNRCVTAQIWAATVGRVKLYLIDTNVTCNSASDRMITSTLYGGDSEMRIQQEIMLGIGGLKALMAMELEPTVCHMNEGHAAFMALERIRQLRSSKNMTFEEAVEATKAGNVFTIHTPVKAGNDEFTVEVMDRYFGHYFANLGINRKQFLALGRFNPEDELETFKMPVLALKLAAYRNGVSELHGEVSRSMWSQLWPDVPNNEVPIKSVTNGIHAKTWLSGELDSLYERYLGSNYADEIVDKSIWKHTDQIPDEELWRTHQRGKEKLVAFARKRLKAQMMRRGSFHTELGWAEEVLDPEALTIGFARRFATYKRGNLLLKDTKRLIKMLTDTNRPVQFIFAGKAHPRDAEGKEIIRQIIHFAAQNNIRRKLVFLEDYDIDIARHMVQGVDIWLNNPRRPMEASGTSGMKAALNGVLNISTLDGWWCEGYAPDGGWVIGAGESYNDTEYGDSVESQALYNLLENEVIPLFFTRSADNLPRAWIHRVKTSIKWIAPQFNTHRMVAEYTRKFYNSAASRWRYLTASAMARARALSMWKSNIKNAWHELAIKDVNVQADEAVTEGGETVVKQPQVEVGTELKISALVRLGKLRPEDVSVEIYYGTVDSWGNIKDGSPSRMNYDKVGSNDGEHFFVGSIPCKISGQHGFAIRVLPRNEDLVDPYEPGLILWENACS
ncbi:MAG: alpha-glucan phosphorylase [Planctomycetes bacterium GWF2_50_10]|nr:MAG: alpha-glucan phosphorylase [Planctomycetes bacterium GWF2_50_10]